MPELITVTVNGQAVKVTAGSSVAAAVMRVADVAFRASVTGEPRAPLCGMGTCFECCVVVNGEPHQRSCIVPCQAGMEIRTDAAT